MLRRAVAIALTPGIKVQEQVTPLAGSLMTPVAVTAFAMAAWALGSEMAWAGTFPIGEGVLSNWRAWLLAALSLQGVGIYLRSAEQKRD